MLAFVFSGQGAQKVGMGLEWFQTSPAARTVFEQADAALGFSLSELCFKGPAAELDLTANSQPAILTTSIALLRVLQEETGLVPSLVAGHSLGEYSALVCAGALDFEDAVRIVHKRGLFMQEAVPLGQGGMAAIMGMTLAEVETLCRDAAGGQILCPANFNGAGQIVIAGHSEALERALKLGAERQVIVRRLPVTAPFHCTLMEPAATRLAAALQAIRFRAPAMPVVSNVTAEPIEDDAEIAAALVKQVTAPVRWEESVRRLARGGVRAVLEIGIGDALTRLIRRIDPGLTVAALDRPSNLQSTIERVAGSPAQVKAAGP
jgi:[acyl-carrier-protein] S-malonyltransferase